jgi:hypothetical protein
MSTIVQGCSGVYGSANRFLVLSSARRAFALDNADEIDTDGRSQCHHFLTSILDLGDEDYAEVSAAHHRLWKTSPLKLITNKAGHTLVFHDRDMIDPPPGLYSVPSTDVDVAAWLKFRTSEREIALPSSLWARAVTLSPLATIESAEELWQQWKAFKAKVPESYSIYQTPPLVARVAEWVHQRYSGSEAKETTADPFGATAELRLNCVGRTLLLMAVLERLSKTDLATPYAVSSNNWVQNSAKGFGHVWVEFPHKTLGSIVLDTNPVKGILIVPKQTLRQVQLLKPDSAAPTTNWLLGKPQTLTQLLCNWYSTLKVKNLAGSERFAVQVFEKPSGKLLPAAARHLPLTDLLVELPQNVSWIALKQDLQLLVLAGERLVDDDSDLLLLDHNRGVLLANFSHLILTHDCRDLKVMLSSELTEKRYSELKELSTEIAKSCRSSARKMKDRKLPEELSFLSNSLAANADEVLHALANSN